MSQPLTGKTALVTGASRGIGHAAALALAEAGAHVIAVARTSGALEELAPDKPPAVGSYEDLIRFVADRPGHDRRYAIDASKIQRELGWVPAESFETGLRKTVRWYLDNEDWWSRVINDGYRLGRVGIREVTL